MRFLLTPAALKAGRDTLEAHQEKLASHLYWLQTQLGTWLVLGNGIGLFVLAQATLSGKLSQEAWLTVTYLRFAIGIALAFVALVSSYFFNLFRLVCSVPAVQASPSDGRRN